MDAESLEKRVETLEFNFNQMRNDELRPVIDRFDTRNTYPFWRRWWMRWNGWPHWTVVAEKPRWRPWHERARSAAEQQLKAAVTAEVPVHFTGWARLRP